MSDIAEPLLVHYEQQLAEKEAEIERLRAAELNYQAAHDLQYGEIERLKTALQAIWKALEEEADHELATLRIKVITRNALGKP